MANHVDDEKQASGQSEGLHWLFTEFHSLEDLMTPIRLNKSIQFTAIDVSKNYIWCGSSRANLYVYDRHTLKHVYLIPTTSNATNSCFITQLTSYRTEHLCASANGGVICISSIQSGSTRKPESIEAFTVSSSVTQLVWHPSSTKLFVGDAMGSVHICSVLTSKLIPKTTLLCQLDSCIVQLDFSDNVLLLSTLTKCAVYQITRKTCVDVGTKPRNGHFGAILVTPDQSSDTERAVDLHPICYCARPGLRLWRADVNGRVLATLNFRQGLAECPTPAIIRSSSDYESSDVDQTAESPIKTLPNTFPYLKHIRDNLLLSVSNARITVLDPNSSQVLLSTDVGQEVASCCTIDKSLYFITKQGEVRCVELTSLAEYIETLLDSETISQALRLCLDNVTHLEGHEILLVRMLEILSTEHPQYQTFIDTFADTIEEYKQTIDGRRSRSSTISSISTYSESDSLSLHSLTLHNVPGPSEGHKTRGSLKSSDTNSLDSSHKFLELKNGMPDTDDSASLPSNANNVVNGNSNSPLNVIYKLELNSAERDSEQSRPEALLVSQSTTTVHQCSVTNAVNSSVTLLRENSSKSLISIDNAMVESLSRKGSITSLSSFDQSEEHLENSHLRNSKSKRRRVKASTVTFPSSKMDGHDSDDEAPVFHPISPSLPIGSKAQSTLCKESSPSPKAVTSPRLSAIARESSLSPKTAIPRELSSPGAVVDHVKDHMKDGLSKISSQALSIISTIKEKTKSQPVIERFLSSSARDDSPDCSGMHTPGELSEDSGSHHAFYIGDEALSMDVEMPSTRTAFNELTNLTYSQLTDPTHLLTSNGDITPQLEQWSQKLCLLLSQYTHSSPKSKSGPESRLLRDLNRMCPWRMNSEQMSKTEYLATMCVIHGCCDALLDYDIFLVERMCPQRCIMPIQPLQVKRKDTPPTACKQELFAMEDEHDFDISNSSLVVDDHERRRVCTRLGYVEEVEKACSLLANEEALPMDFSEDTPVNELSEGDIEQTHGAIEQGEGDIEQGEGDIEQGEGDIEQGEGSDIEQGEGDIEQSDGAIEQGELHVEQGERHVEQGEGSIEQSEVDSAGDKENRTAVSMTTVAQFMSTFWFAMDTKALCTYLEQLSMIDDRTDTLRGLWIPFINCLAESKVEKLEWRDVFNMSSLFSTSDKTRKLMLQNDAASLWLYMYLLMRQGMLDDAVSVALGSHALLPPFHVLHSLHTTCELGDLAITDAHQVFVKYVQSLIHVQDISCRSTFIRSRFCSTQLLIYWLDSLETCWKVQNDTQKLCSCFKPCELARETGSGSSLQINTSHVIKLLEENMWSVERVRSTVLLIGGAGAMLRQRMRENAREQVLKILLLSADVATFRQHLGGFKLNRDDYLYLLQQRALQQAAGSDDVRCLWCNSTSSRSQPPLQWDSIAALLLELLGVEECVAVLSECSLPADSVSSKFFSHCFRLYRDNINSSHVVADVIEGLEKFLWSSERSDKNVDPALHHLMQTEAELCRASREGQPIRDSQHNQLLEMSNALRQNPSLRTIEGSETHWGVLLSLDEECYCCGLPLSHSSIPVTVFRCGHSSHQSCLSSVRECPQCSSA